MTSLERGHVGFKLESLRKLGYHLPSLVLNFSDCTSKMGIFIVAMFPKCGIWLTGGTEVSFGNK